MTDPRFGHIEWQENSWYRGLRDTYLAGSTLAREWLKQLPLEGQMRGQAEFALAQFLDAAAPTNYLATNPAALQRLQATEGASLQAGLQHLQADLAVGRIGLSQADAFAVGRNLAVTPGAVVFRNELIELIQYQPLTPKVYATPLLIVPPCINKFYILDLQAENSFVRHAVEAGHSVFLISWKNPHAEQSHFTWDDYLELGPIAALAAVQSITRKRQVNTLGFCVGGTILSSALSVLAARGARGSMPAKSLTLLATLLEFSDVGQIGVLVDERQVEAREAQFAEGGIMPGREIAAAFSALRANDLVWNPVVNKYLLGATPPPFDLLHWNGDATNLPGPMFAWYLRNLYLENRLKDGMLEGAGQQIDLLRVTCPQYVLATREDHIVPWGSAYAALNILGGTDKRFVLGGSGHVAGIVNPPAKRKRSYWAWRADGKNPRATKMSAAQWLQGAQEVPGSWWPDWIEWLGAQGGALVRAPARCGSIALPPLEPAPGSYVKELA